MCLGPALSALGLSCGKHGALLNDLSSFNGVFLLFCVVRYWTKFFRSIARFFYWGIILYRANLRAVYAGAASAPERIMVDVLREVLLSPLSCGDGGIDTWTAITYRRTSPTIRSELDSFFMSPKL